MYKLTAVVALYPERALLIQQKAGRIGGGKGTAAGHKHYLLQAAVFIQIRFHPFHYVNDFLHSLNHRGFLSFFNYALPESLWCRETLRVHYSYISEAG